MENNNSWEESKLIGNSAENIVSFLINSSPDWKCIKFGVENHILDLKKTVRKEINSVTKKIKSMPDFVAFNTKTGETFFVEVKYFSFIDKRTKGKIEYRFKYKRLDEYIKYWKGIKLIVVCPFNPHFILVDLKDVEKNMLHREQTGVNEWTDYWNFADIQKPIKDLLPELSDEALQKAINMIPKK